MTSNEPDLRYIARRARRRGPRRGTARQRRLLRQQRMQADRHSWCCWGVVHNGPRACTCWEPVYDIEQSPPVEPMPDPVARATPCADCACRPDSPERVAYTTGEDTGVVSTWEGVRRLATTGDPFFCHQGMRRLLAERHPNGRTRTVGAHGHEPAMHEGVPLKADGTPADLCAGWAALAAVADTADV